MQLLRVSHIGVSLRQNSHHLITGIAGKAEGIFTNERSLDPVANKVISPEKLLAVT